MADGVPKMIVTVSSGHAGQPSSGGGMQGAWGLAFQKAYLDGDSRWVDVLLAGDYDDTSIENWRDGRGPVGPRQLNKRAWAP